MRFITMKKLFIIPLTLSFYDMVQATESSIPPEYYQEFYAAVAVISLLNTAVNKTALPVKSPHGMKHGNLELEINRSWNTTDAGLLLYLVDGMPAQVRSPFGDIMLYWQIQPDRRWQKVIQEVTKVCAISEKAFVEGDSFVHAHTYQITKIGANTLPNTEKIFQADQGRRKIFDACRQQYQKDGGTLVELNSLKDRQRLLAQQKKSHSLLTLFNILFRPFDLSN